MTFVFPQELLNPGRPLELYFETVNIPTGTQVMELYLTSQSQSWGVTLAPKTYLKDNSYNNIECVPDMNNITPENECWGFDFYSSHYSEDPYDRFAYGLYRVTNNLNDFYFYLDYRDDRYSFSLQYIDVFLKYDNSTQTWKIRNEGG
jgi:hypothetical protein